MTMLTTSQILWPDLLCPKWAIKDMASSIRRTKAIVPYGGLFYTIAAYVKEMGNSNRRSSVDSDETIDARAERSAQVKGDKKPKEIVYRYGSGNDAGTFPRRPYLAQLNCQPMVVVRLASASFRNVSWLDRTREPREDDQKDLQRQYHGIIESARDELRYMAMRNADIATIEGARKGLETAASNYRISDAFMGEVGEDSFQNWRESDLPE